MNIVTCPKCGTKNRVDERAVDRQPKCGRCGEKLSMQSNGKPVELCDATLEAALKSAGNRPVLVDCWATWCPPCRMIAPTIDQLAAEANGRWVIAKLDVDHSPQTSSRFRIDSIPALLIFKNGQLVEKLVGVQPKQAIVAKLQKTT